MRKFIIFFFSFIFWFSNANSFSAEARKSIRIISLAPSITEILFALGLDEEIIAVTSFCDFPSQAKQKEKVGSFSNPDIEKIISLKPDIIFATGLEQISIVENLHKLNLKVFVSDPSSFDELCKSIQTIGSLTAKSEEANQLIEQMKKRIERITTKTSKISKHLRPKVFIEIWHDPLTTAGKKSFVNELIDLAGGINIAENVNRGYFTFSAEQVIKSNPDCIIVGYMDRQIVKENFNKRQGWSNLSAVKNGRVYDDIDPNLFLRPGPRLVEGLEKIYQKLYPVRD